METDGAGTLETEDGWYTGIMALETEDGWYIGNNGIGNGGRWNTETTERGGRWNCCLFMWKAES